MPTDLPSTLLLLARLLMGGAFLVFGVRNFRSFQKMRPGMAEKRVPLPDVALAIGLLLQAVVGALVLFGIFTPWGAAALILFLVLATVMYTRSGLSPARSALRTSTPSSPTAP